MTSTLAGIVPIWVLAAVGALVVGAVAPVSERFTGLGIVLASALVVAFVVQLARGRAQGFVVRVSASVAGAAVILMVATGILAIVR